MGGFMESNFESKSRRVVIVGSVLIALAVAFFFYMLSIASRSNDPAALMQTVGTVSGVVGGIGLTMIIVGLFRKSSSKRSI
jgi:TRAP-type mannitol/chloroaromatic compound transport system permease large subunit